MLIFFLLFFWACSNTDSDFTENDSKIVRSFYHWKQDFSLNQEQKNTLTQLKVTELYVHYFDIVWDGTAAVPAAEVANNEVYGFEIKPVIYITTGVFENIDSTKIKDLASKTAERIKRIHKQEEIKEVQFDCDWTASIQEKYFYFLTEMKQYFETSVISSTIRLYQYKYPDLAGVPPVDKGLLMYYNMGEITSHREKNSILNNDEGRKYLGFNSYPLNIDIALPNFSWVLLFRSGEFQQICGQLDKSDLQNSHLFKQITPNKFMIKNDTVIGNTYFRFGDELRFEDCSKPELMDAATILKDEINQDKTRIIFYDLQLNTPDDYEKLDAVFSSFKH